MTPAEVKRFCAKLPIGGVGCWEWTAGRSYQEYGQFKLRGKTEVAHRLSYELFVAPVPAGLLVMHSCDNPPCVNPAHLSVGTHSDNHRDRDDKKRGPHSRLTRCPSDHPYDEANTPVTKEGHRQCRECNRIRGRRNYQKKRGAL